MTNSPTQLHPAAQFFKDNIVVIGLVVIVAASVAFFVFTQAKPEAQPAAAVAPTSVPTAALDKATGAPAAPGSSTGPTSVPEAATGSQSAAQPSPTATPAQAVLGKGPQGVEAKDWKIYAQDFAKAWVNTAGGKEAWLGRLKPMVSAELYSGFTKTDITTIPTSAYRSVSLAEESMAAKTFRAYNTNGPMFEGRVSVQADGSWVVDQIAPPEK